MDFYHIDNQITYVSDGGTETQSEDEPVERDSSFYFADVVLHSRQVEECLFKIPRRNLENESETFRDMFSLPVPEGQQPEGTSDARPITLTGVKKDEFRQLLRVLYPSRFSTQDDLSVEQWTSVLKVSTMWEFEAVRELAIRKLSSLAISDLDSIVLARKYNVNEWLLPAIHSLVRREEPMGMQEVDKIGIDWALKIAAIREAFSYLQPQGGTYCSCYGGYVIQATAGTMNGGIACDRRGPKHSFDFTQQIKTVFALES